MERGGYSTLCEAWYVEGDGWTPVTETVALEVPVAIHCNGLFVEEISCTPEDVEDLVIGYLYTSGVIDALDDVSLVEVAACTVGLEAHVCSPRLNRALERSRARCPAGDCPAGGFEISPEAVHRASSALLGVQDMHRNTGATHAAVFADVSGSYRFVREDIGRHNAVDKLIGALLRNDVDPSSGFVHLSSRCALDLVKKCSTFGIRLISTVSAPTSAVLDFADERGITLCAFARNGHFTVYTHPEHLSR